MHCNHELLSFPLNIAGTTGASLSQVLQFFSGASAIPPMGFDIRPTITFDDKCVFPTSSTCALQMTLPLQYYLSQELFEQKMVYAILNNGGFGML